MRIADESIVEWKLRGGESGEPWLCVFGGLPVMRSEAKRDAANAGCCVEKGQVPRSGVGEALRFGCRLERF